jgi:hypothetical protein
VTAGLILAACGGGAGSDPVATIQEIFKLVESKQFARIADFACAASKDEATETFDFSRAMTDSLGEGVDPQKILEAMSFKAANMEYIEVSRSADAAVVHVKGRLEIAVDANKFKAIVVDILKAQGLGELDPAVLEQATSGILAQFEGFGQDLDVDMNLVNESGRWLICR